MSPLPLKYPEILNCFGRHNVEGGTESRAFLAWFLENYYRFDETEIYDSVCDGPNDKGIDGIYVNEQLRQIDIFQTTISKTAECSFGDGKLKQFTGAISQLSTPENADSVFAVANKELQAIAKRMNLAAKIADSYEIRGVFITNATPDPSAKTYLATQNNLVIYDGGRLNHEFVSPDKTDPISEEFSFDVSGQPALPLPIGNKLKMIIAPVLATELVSMSGIANGELFAWNVRQYLGKKTAVNKSVAESIQNKAEHSLFPAFHNGITILCRNLMPDSDKIKISGYAVVNGCQSITSLFEQSKFITSDLRILTKFIEVEPDSELAKKITDHTNNQNGITARDLQSNSLVQTRLQAEIHKKIPSFRYRIKRGEHPEWPKESVIENELLARIILAFDLNRPEAWSQNYKLFDDLHSEIFGRKEVNADRAIFLYDCYNVTLQQLEELDDKLFGKYVLTRWLVLLLLKEALTTDELGRKLFVNPGTFLASENGRERIRICVAHVTLNVVRLLNGEINRQKKSESGYFDYKRDLKNKEYIANMVSKIIPFYQIMLDGGLTENFSNKWNSVK